METRVAIISIIVEDGGKIEEINRLLHETNEYIIGRMGIPYRQKGISIISIAIDAPQYPFRKDRTSQWRDDENGLFKCDHKNRIDVSFVHFHSYLYYRLKTEKCEFTEL